MITNKQLNQLVSISQHDNVIVTVRYRQRKRTFNALYYEKNSYQILYSYSNIDKFLNTNRTISLKHWASIPIIQDEITDEMENKMFALAEHLADGCNDDVWLNIHYTYGLRYCLYNNGYHYFEDFNDFYTNGLAYITQRINSLFKKEV
jgi:hypothetical protein